MRTARTKIDVYSGSLTMEFDGETIGFNISDTMRYPSDVHSCFSINTVDTLAQKFMETINEDELEEVLTKSIGLSAKGYRIPEYDFAKEDFGIHARNCVGP